MGLGGGVRGRDARCAGAVAHSRGGVSNITGLQGCQWSQALGDAVAVVFKPLLATAHNRVLGLAEGLAVLIVQLGGSRTLPRRPNLLPKGLTAQLLRLDLLLAVDALGMVMSVELMKNLVRHCLFKNLHLVLQVRNGVAFLL